MLRNLPPDVTATYALAHDQLLLNCASKLLEQSTPFTYATTVGQQISLPLRVGGLGLRSAHRLAPGAYWASMGDSLPGIGDNLWPQIAV